MNHEYLPLAANSGDPNFPVFLLGIASCFLFLLLGFLIGWRIWRRFRLELLGLDEENRKLAKAYKAREKNFIEQQEKLTRLARQN